MNTYLTSRLDPQQLKAMLSSPSFLYFALGLLLLLLAKPIKGLTTRYNLSAQITGADNKAVAVATAGYLFGVLLVIRGVMLAGSDPALSVWRDLGSVVLWSAISLLLLLCSAWINRKFLLREFDVHKELLQDRNVGTAAVLAATYIGTAMIIAASISGSSGQGFVQELLEALLYFVIGQIGFILLGVVYKHFCGYDVHAAIEQDNAAAGISFGATLIAMAILFSGQIRRCDSLLVLLVWMPLSMLILMAARWMVDLIILPGARIKKEIETDRNWGVALIESVALLGSALLLDACFG